MLQTLAECLSDGSMGALIVISAGTPESRSGTATSRPSRARRIERTSGATIKVRTADPTACDAPVASAVRTIGLVVIGMAGVMQKGARLNFFSRKT